MTLVPCYPQHPLAFLQTYQQLHPSGFRSLDRNVRYRLLLCRFITLFLRRIDPGSSFARKPQTTIIHSRKRRVIQQLKYVKRRGIEHVFPDDRLLRQFIIASSGKRGIPPERLIYYCAERFGPSEEGLEGAQEGDQQQTGDQGCSLNKIWGTASLSDTLPLFMLLSAWTSATVAFSPVNSLWMSIAGSFMAHAFIEDYLCHGVTPLQALSENFAWGVVPVTDGGEEEDTMEEIIINEMFGADGGEVGVGWEKLRKQILEELIPPQGGPGLEQHLSTNFLVKPENDSEDEGNISLIGTFSLFEKRLVDGMILALVRAVQKPVLAQLEQGRLEGLESGEVEALLARAGIPREI